MILALCSENDIWDIQRISKDTQYLKATVDINLAAWKQKYDDYFDINNIYLKRN